MNIRILTITAFSLLSLGTLTTSLVQAHSGATGVVKERMTVMSNIGKNMKKMAAMVKGKETFDAAKMAQHAQSIADVAPEVNELFPKDSIYGPSEALPAIWEEWDDFASLNQRLTEETTKLQEIAKSGDRRAITMQFAKVGKVCSSCHTDYRKKQEKKD